MDWPDGTVQMRGGVVGWATEQGGLWWLELEWPSTRGTMRCACVRGGGGDGVCGVRVDGGTVDGGTGDGGTGDGGTGDGGTGDGGSPPKPEASPEAKRSGACRVRWLRRVRSIARGWRRSAAPGQTKKEPQAKNQRSPPAKKEAPWSRTMTPALFSRTSTATPSPSARCSAAGKAATEARSARSIGSATNCAPAPASPSSARSASTAD
eukprot:scaffold2822_cov100-Isochrysis_galbana.AAC.6